MTNSGTWETKAARLMEKGDCFAVLNVVTDLKTPLDTFFDEGMVMVEDPTIRGNRLGLLKMIADFSFTGSTA